MPKDVKRRPISARVNLATYEALAAAAKKSGRSISLIVEAVLDDYVAWLKDQRKK